MNGLSPPPLNIQPRGLLDFYGIKNGGRYPTTLGETYQPVTDLTSHYEYANTEYVSVALTTYATGNNVFVPVQGVNNIARILRCSVRFTFANALDSFSGYWAILSTNDPLNQPMRIASNGADGVDYVFPANATLLSYHMAISDIWLRPGTTLGIWQRSGVNTAGGASMNIMEEAIFFRQ